MSGGAGYVLSREAVRRFVEIATRTIFMCQDDDVDTPEDVGVGICLSQVNVSAVDSRDSLGRGTFFPFEPVAHLTPNLNTLPGTWYANYSVYGFESVRKHCQNRRYLH